MEGGPPAGAPGADGGAIRIRGINSFGGSSTAPLVLIDGAHNESGAAALGASLEGIAAGELHILIGMLADKDVRRSVEQTLPLARRVYAVQPRQNPRAMPSAELAGLAREFCPEVEDWGDRLEEAFASAYAALSPGDTLLVCGAL